MPAFDELRAVLASVRIVHHIRGRVRFKLDADADLAADLVFAARELPRAKRLDRAVERIPGVRTVRANALARSCTVEYDPLVIPDDAWRDFLSGVDSAAASTLERILRETYRELSHAQP
jgi:hypothetical protein